MLRKKTKCIVATFLLALSHVSSAASHEVIANYASLLNAITNGDTVRAVFSLKKCTPSNLAQANNIALAGIDFTNFNKSQSKVSGQQKNMIATSMTMLVKDSQWGSVLNYVRLRVYEDNTTEIVSEYIQPKTYQQLSSTSYSCRLGTDSNQDAMILYDMS